MKWKWLVVVACCSAEAALAQDSGLSVSVGARAWFTDWTTFSYYTEGTPPQNLALTEVTADGEIALMPMVSLRYQKFVGTLSAFTSTRYAFDNGSRGERDELDANVGYYLMTGLAVTVGYKQIDQSDGPVHYRPRGPVVGLSANAPLGGAWSMYGNVGVGWLETPGGDEVAFDADYRLAELGLAYSLGTRVPKSWTFTAGYRIQVLTSEDAFETQDGRDTTDGFTLGVLATF
jgi:hypothetical protein